MLADRAGIAAEYYDIAGTLHVTSDETRRAILSAMGFRVSTRAELVAELIDWDNRPWLRCCEPVHVVRQGRHPGSWLCAVPCERGEETALQVRWTLRDEQGALCYERDEGPGWEIQEERVIDGRRYIRLAFGIPADLPLGYYRAVVCTKGGEVERKATFLLIVAPARCYVSDRFLNGGRLWGLSLQLYSLRSQYNWGVGDFGDLADLVEWAGRKLGAAVVGLNPLHALKNSIPYHISPYSPNSRLFLNELYIDVEQVPECAAPEVRRRLADPSFCVQLDKLRGSELIDYEGVAQAKRAILELCYEIFLRDNFPGDEADRQPKTERGAAFDSYVKKEGDSLVRYAVFQALDEEQQAAGVTQWTNWPAEFRHPSSDAVARYQCRERKKIGFFLYIQWLAAQQMKRLAEKSVEAGMTVGFYHDLALGSDRNGADGWRYQDVLVLEADCGAPPDAFAPQGQNWGFPPVDPLRLRASGYAPFIEVLRRNLRYGGAIRVDHVMALFRLFWIPWGLPASMGTYVRYPWEDLLAILALESVRANALIIGEDLGTVPDWIRERLHEAGVLSYRVFFFERTATGEWKPPGAYPSQSVAVVTTHDLPTLSGYWEGTDIDLRTQLIGGAEHTKRTWLEERHRDKSGILAALKSEGLLPPDFSLDPGTLPVLTEELALAIHRYLARTPAWLMLVTVEDVIGVRDQINLPGTVDCYPNWRRKLPLTVEELMSDRRFERLANELRSVRGST
ncbi:MAG: 4-alpha-glucanotransferase [Nitrospira sp.]|nr:4-alpha-glucanotransferase [Nitrospira sp.]